MNDYLQHSRKGTTWRKDTHDYYKRQGKRYYYAYEAAQKQAWRLKKKAEKALQKPDTNRNSIANRHKRQANEDIAATYRDVADVQETFGAKDQAKKTRQKATEYERRAKDVARYSEADIKKVQRNNKYKKIKNSASDAYNKAKMVMYKPLRKVTKSTIDKGKVLFEKILKRK